MTNDVCLLNRLEKSTVGIDRSGVRSKGTTSFFPQSSRSQIATLNSAIMFSTTKTEFKLWWSQLVISNAIVTIIASITN